MKSPIGYLTAGSTLLLALGLAISAVAQNSRPSSNVSTPSRRASRQAPASVEAPAFTPAQISSMQNKEFDADFETAYKATAAALHEQGWQIDLVDKASGLIQASSFRTQDVIGPEDDERTDDPVIQETRQEMREFNGRIDMSMAVWTRWDRLTVLIEQWGRGKVRVRISIVKYGSLPSGLHFYPFPKAFGYTTKKVLESAREQSVRLIDPKTYEVIFQQIRNGITARQNVARNQ